MNTRAALAKAPIFFGKSVTCFNARPTSDEQREAAIAEAAQGSQQHVVGPVVDIEAASVGGLFDRGVHADAGALIAGVGQGGQAVGWGGVQRAQGVFVGGDQVMRAARLDGRGPDR